MAKTDEIKEVVKQPAVFGKAKLLKCDKYAKYKDCLAVLLNGDKSYSFAEVDEILGKFLKKGRENK